MKLKSKVTIISIIIQWLYIYFFNYFKTIKPSYFFSLFSEMSLVVIKQKSVSELWTVFCRKLFSKKIYFSIIGRIRANQIYIAIIMPMPRRFIWSTKRDTVRINHLSLYSTGPNHKIQELSYSFGKTFHSKIYF